MIWRIGVLLITLVSSCFATSACPDPKMRGAVIGGDSITGVVLLKGKPVSALVSLYSARGKFVRAATTEENGTFALNKIPPGKYSLNVPGWGSTSIQVSPKAARDFPQKPSWFLTLMDNECVSIGISMD